MISGRVLRSLFATTRIRAGRLAALVAFVCAGCSTTNSKLRAQFARERACPESQVGVHELGGNVYEASGCGKTAQYACEGFASSAAARAPCVERGLGAQAPAGGDRPSFPETEQQMDPGSPGH
jgi:hypothetical protein